MKFLKLLLPPIAKSIYFEAKRVLDFKKNIYLTYSEAIKSIGVEYNNEDIAKVVFQKTVLQLQKNRQYNYKYSLNDIKLLFSFLVLDKCVKVLDVGGACGIHFHIVKGLNPSLELQWDVLETENMVKLNLNNDFSGLNFYSDFESIKNNKYDIIYLSSVLQYIEEPYSFLDKILMITAKFIFIVRTPFSEEVEEFYSIQKSRLSANGPGEMPSGIVDREIQYAVYNFSESKFLRYLKEKNNLFVNVIEEDGFLLINHKKNKLKSIVIKNLNVNF